MNKIWVFQGKKAQFSCGVFTSIEEAEIVIHKYKLEGVLTCYPVNKLIYDWAIQNNFFEPKKDYQSDAKFIQTFTSAYLEHFHFMND